MNVWYEEPYKYSIGLSFSPIFGSSRATDDNNKPYGDKVKLISTGIEYKVFPHKIFAQTYTRLGLGYSQFWTEEVPERSVGFNFYWGFGYEFPFKNFGLALELGYRYTKLDNDISINSVIPSIGFHFYEMI